MECCLACDAQRTFKFFKRESPHEGAVPLFCFTIAVRSGEEMTQGRKFLTFPPGAPCCQLVSMGAPFTQEHAVTLFYMQVLSRRSSFFCSCCFFLTPAFSFLFFFRHREPPRPKTALGKQPPRRRLEDNWRGPFCLEGRKLFLFRHDLVAGSSRFFLFFSLFLVTPTKEIFRVPKVGLVRKGERK